MSLFTFNKYFPLLSVLKYTINHGSRNLLTRQNFPSRTQKEYYSTENRIKMPGEICVLKYSKLSDKAHAPVRGSEYAAGFDLKSAYDYIVPAHGKELVKTDLQVVIPDGCYGRVAPRSGLAWKNFIDVGAGVIDVDYRGNVGVVIFNHGDCDFIIKNGDRIAQLICEKIAYPFLEEVKSLDETTRGSGGFGSSGTR
ncbi:deoxyuridine 5'-triphosphate nucleotidohydrolase [Halyomorpha halys]|uniref:deoxyuridine 5'-triphosphate nucleotidohydrolase n=1 Tax=Halyomorpha halys TaxID=286706 RepID=UPI0006D52365|nr:deoxyuridine 5'-triphosphate nucleotidohydrolase [Halyomorpha halys]